MHSLNNELDSILRKHAVKAATASEVNHFLDLAKIVLARNVDVRSFALLIESVRKDPEFLDLCCKSLGHNLD